MRNGGRTKDEGRRLQLIPHSEFRIPNSKENPHRAYMIYFICKMLMLILARPYFRVKVFGRENIPGNTPILFISNHASYSDPPLIGMCIPGQIHYMAKKELFATPVSAWFFRKLRCIPINRAGVDRKGIMACRRILESGKRLLLFPEGTRTETGEMQEIKSGAALLINDLFHVPIVPVYIDGTYQAFPKGAKFPRRVPVTIRFGEPFKITQKGVALDKKDYYKSLAILFYEKIKALKRNSDTV